MKTAAFLLLSLFLLGACDEIADVVTGGGGGSLDLTGRWTGTISSTVLGDSGQFQVDLEQSRNTVTGVASIGGSACLSGGTITGTVSEKRVSLTLTDSTGATVTLSGSGKKNIINGLFSSVGGSAGGGCSANSGEWVLNRS